jgi:hypothetical protein
LARHPEFSKEAFPPIESNVVEAESYDKKSLADKKQMAASKAEGVP